MITANEDFHNTIYGFLENPTLVKIIHQLKAQSHIQRYYSWSSPDVVQRIQKEHLQLIKGLENKDLKLLNDMARRPISYSKDSYLQHLKAKRANFLKGNEK